MAAGEGITLQGGYRLKTEAKGNMVHLILYVFGIGHPVAIDPGTAMMLADQITTEAAKAQRHGKV